MSESSSHSMPLAGHLEALRSALLRVLIVAAGGVVLGVIFAKPIFSWLAAPMEERLPEGAFFITTQPVEAFMAYLKVGLIGGLFLSLPVMFYQLWRFIAPGLLVKERWYGFIFVMLTSLCFIGGAVFGYAVVFPTSFDFFVGLLADTEIQFMPRMEDYLSFAVRLLFAFGIVFELPVIVYLLARWQIVSRRQLIRFRPYVVILSFIVGGLMTGPDVASQFLMAVPLIVLYELSLLVAWATRAG